VLPLPLPALALSAQLAAAQIQIAVTADTARVDARYELAGPRDSIRLALIRLPGQTVRVEATDGLQQNELAGLTRLIVNQAGAVITVRFTVAGRLDRIPVPVPDRPTLPGAKGISITVDGLPSNARLAEAFPRLHRAGGSARAELANVPSLVRLPPERGGWTLTDLTEAFVLVLVLGSSAAWVIRAGRRRGGGGA
jgi:hypothetical protein